MRLASTVAYARALSERRLFLPLSIASLQPGTAHPEVPGYTVERELGRGGMATVYLARQNSLDRQVAIKVMVSEAGQDESMAQRFESEARVIAKLEHPGIVGIHEVGRTSGGRLYYVMPYLPNGDLAQRDLSQNELGIVKLIHALLDALGYAHTRGVVHRDVKPENVLFDAMDRPRLADFGIALSSRAGNARITSDGMALGSSGYMSPEQARGDHVDGRADLYAVGVLAYELVTGELPFRSTDPLALAIRHAQDPVPRLPPAKRHWQGFIDRAMAKRPASRFRSAASMTRALNHVERSIQRRQRGSIRAWMAVPPLRDSPVLLMGLGLGLSLALGVGISQWLGRSAAGTTADNPSSEAPSERGRIETLLGDAAVQLRAGNLTEPAGANAAETYLAILALQPDHLEAMQGMDVVFDALGKDMASALESDQDEVARMRVEQARLLSDSLPEAIPRSGLTNLLARAQRALDERVQDAHQRRDRGKAESALSLLNDLGLDTSASAALVRQLQAWPEAGASLRDPGGPALVFVPEGTGTGGASRRAFGLMQRPVSVSEYRRFAQATQRTDSRCRARLSPLRVVDRRTWGEPGFEQRDSDPVVCISHADAEAYAAWVSRQTGQRYRLPAAAELRAGGASSPTIGSGKALHEWSGDCEQTSPRGDCSQRLALGAAGSQRGSDPARGFEDIGFRLVRELSLENLPPAS